MSSRGKPRAQMISFAKIASHANLRCDAKYRLFWGEVGDTIYLDSKVPCFPMKLATVDQRTEKLKKGDLNSEYELIELEDVEARTGNILTSTVVTKIKSDKLLFGDTDLLTTRLRPYLGKTIVNDHSKPMAGTTEWIPIKVRRERLQPLLLKYYLLSPVYIENAARLLSGKEHPRIAESDILSLKVPFFDEEMQARLVSRIEKLEKDITTERKKVKPDQTVIDEILCEAFDYPLAEHLKRERMRDYTKLLSALSAGFTLRCSSRYHHPDYELVKGFFLGIPHVRVKRYISIPIKLGATAKKGDFIEEGEAFYVHPGATKKQEVIELEDCYQVSYDYYLDNHRRAGLKPGDIIINRSGEAHGKVAFWDSTEPALASDFTMRVRPNEDANPRFIWYFFRSLMFQAQIYREIMGASVHNVFPSQVEQFFIVECERNRQDQIADQITSELSNVHKAKSQINIYLRDIHSLIATAVAGKPLPALK